MADRRNNFTNQVTAETKKYPGVTPPGPSSGGASGFTRSDFTRTERGAKPENQHQFLTALIGKPVKLNFITGDILEGDLLWHDNFNLCIKVGSNERMVFKGSLAWVEGNED
jgi:sRNA-binding regulator protein Hfq